MAFSVADVIEQLDASLDSGSGDEERIESTQEPDLEAQTPTREVDDVFEANPDLGSDDSGSDECLSDSPGVDEPSSSLQMLSEPSEDSQSEQCSDNESCNEELPRKRGTRKRLRQPDKWKRNKRKRRRNSGQRYISTAKKLVRKQTELL